MPQPASPPELDFYRAVREHDPQDAGAGKALRFARTFADLAQRMLVLQAAQQAKQAEVPQPLALPAFLAYAHQGPDLSAAFFAQSCPAGWEPQRIALLAQFARWLARVFQAGNPLSSSLQVWSGRQGQSEMELYGTSGLTDAPSQTILHAEPPLAQALKSGAAEPVALIAHYDVHGLAMLAWTLRYLRRLGINEVDVLFSFELTGDIGKLWKRTVPQALASPKHYKHVILLDCSVDSRRPQRTLKAFQSSAEGKHKELTLIDHHQDTFLLAADLAFSGCGLVLTDVLSCGLSDSQAGYDAELMLLGALGDKVPEVHEAYSPASHPLLHTICEELHQRLIQFSPTPKEMVESEVQPLKPIWERLAAGPLAPGLAEDLLGPLPAWEEPPLPKYVLCGSLAFVIERIPRVGRTWYALLERLMADSGLHYATALRVLDNKRANILLLTRWNSIHMPPVRSFIPELYHPACLGHPAAQWVDLDRSEALEFYEQFAERLNEFCGTPDSFTAAARELRKNILDAGGPQPM